MKKELILLKRLELHIPPQRYSYEVHVGEIRQSENLLFKTMDGKLAEDIVTAYNLFIITPNIQVSDTTEAS